MPTVIAPAKLTLSLRITGLRPNGYHTIDAEMVTIDLIDTVEIDESADGLEIVDEQGREAPGSFGAADQNLVTKALDLVGRSARVRIHKRIPVGAGLGGGSADAAAVLRWAGHTDPAQATTIGADVPFCLVGGRAHVEGIGEVVSPLAYEERRFTLVSPPIHCATAAVYGAWDELGGPVGANGNDLEPAALAIAPELALWRDDLERATGATPRLAGSGSSWFVEGDHPGVGRRVVKTVPAHSPG